MTTALPSVARWLYVAVAAVWLVCELRQALKRRPEAVKASGGGLTVVRLAGALGIGAAVAASRWVPSASFDQSAVAAWIGLVVLSFGISLRLWSFRTLGRYFTITVQTSGDQPVITDGPYRVIRHPSYAGLLLCVIGIGLSLGNWLALLGLTAAVACGVVFRIRVEERALFGALGDRYRDYASTHERLVPLVW